MEEVRENREQYEKMRNLLTEYQLIVDSTEQPTARPVDYEEQKKYYSGKKKMHFKKISLLFYHSVKDIVDVPVGSWAK